MNAFEYRNPVKVIFGAGTLARIGEVTAEIGKRAMVVSYKDHTALDVTLDAVCSRLREANVEVTTYYAAEPNPEITMAEKGVTLAKKAGVEVVIGVGGGSAMDTAKTIAAGVLYKGGALWNMVFSRHDDIRAVPPDASLPTVMVPTLPATGSEMNNCAVVTNAALCEKSYIWSPHLFARIAILDPELTYGLPPFQTACGGVDTISHVLEIYLNGQDKSDLLHAWQLSLMRTVVENLPRALKNGADADARTELMWCATCALNGWASPGDAWTPMHQVGHVLTARHGVNHGTSLALMMPTWMRHFSARKPERYFAFARQVMKIDPHGKTAPQIVAEGIDAFESFIRTCGVKTRLSEVGVTTDNLPGIVAGVKKVSFNAQGVLSCNPPVSEEELLQILKEAM